MEQCADLILSTSTIDDQLRKFQKHSHYEKCKDSKRLLDFQQCKSGFPRMPMNTTILLLPQSEISNQTRIKNLRRVEFWKNRITELLDRKEINLDFTFNDWLNVINVTEEVYLDVLRNTLTRPVLFLKRRIFDAYVNDFILVIGRICRCNSDAQFIMTTLESTAYVTKYVVKPEPVKVPITINEVTPLQQVAQLFAEREFFRTVSKQEAALIISGRKIIIRTFESYYLPWKSIITGTSEYLKCDTCTLHLKSCSDGWETCWRC